MKKARTGDGTTTKGERSFTNFNEASVGRLVEENGFTIIECDLSSDIRPERTEEKWVNVIARKI